MSSLPLLVVVGATGTQGGSVINHFLSLSPRPYRLRGITRNASSTTAEALTSRGVEMVSANLDDPASLVKAFEGANALFSVTDFWRINEWVYEYELQQGKNVFDAATKITTLERVVFSSLANVRKWSNGKYTHVWHFDSKAHAEAYCKETYPDLWKKMSVLLVGGYLSNWLIDPLFAPRKDENGVWVFAGMMPGDEPLPLIAAEVDTGPLTHALLQCPPGKNLLGYREQMSFDKYIEIFAKVTGVKTKKITMDFEQTVQSGGEDLGLEFAENMAFQTEFGYAAQKVDKSVIGFEQLEVPVKLGTVEEWVRLQDWSKLLEGKVGAA